MSDHDTRAAEAAEAAAAAHILATDARDLVATRADLTGRRDYRARARANILAQRAHARDREARHLADAARYWQSRA